MDRKRLILILLLVALFIAILYQVVHLKSYGSEGSIARKKAAPRITARPHLKQKETQPPHINLNFLKEIDATPQPPGRNLFKFDQVKIQQVRVAEKLASEVEQPSPEGEQPLPTLPKEIEAAKREAEILQKITNARFLGYAEVKGVRIAGIRMDDYILLGLEGDIIAKKFNIIKIADKYLEIGIPNSSQKQRLPLEGE